MPAAGAGTAAAPTEGRAREPERSGTPRTRVFSLHEGSCGRSAAFWGSHTRSWCQFVPAPPLVAHPGLRDLSAASDGAPCEPPGRVTARKKRQSAAGAGLPEPAGHDGGSPSRAGPGAGPRPGGLAGGWDCPPFLGGRWHRGEEPSPVGSQVFVLTYSRRQACGWGGNERCPAQPLPGPIFSFAGEDRESPWDRRQGSTALQLDIEKGRPPGICARPGGRVPVPSCGGEDWRATVLPAHARGRRAAALPSTRREGDKPPTSFYCYHNHYYHCHHRFSAHK